MTATPRNSPEQILRWWESRYGRLSPDLQRRFLQRSEVEKLAQLPPNTVQRSLDSSPKLASVLAAARIIQASHKQKAQALVAQLQAGAQRRPSRQRASTPKASNRIRRTTPMSPPTIVEALDRAIIGSGISPSAPATYGSGLVHSPGRSEIRNGYRCSSCRAFVPDGASHDC